MGHISTEFAGLPLTDFAGTAEAPEIRTNRDFYVAIACLRNKHREEQRDLETYLSALVGVARKYRDEAHFSLAAFAGLLHEALDAPAVSVASAKSKLKVNGANGHHWDPYECWEHIILQQIAELREMREAGLLDDARDVVRSPHGAVWHNVSVPEYLECAAAGTFGGWDLGDETGVREVNWYTAQKFLNAGQRYE